MTQILFIQGAGENVHDEWDSHLVSSLQRELGDAYNVRYPRLPDESNPTLASWRPVLEQEFSALDAGSIVVGHSVGGTLALNVLARMTEKPALAAIVLIASPYVGKGGWEFDEFETPHNVAELLPSGATVMLYHGMADEEVPSSHADLYAQILPNADVRKLKGKDHQLNNDLSDVANDIRHLGQGSV